MVNVGYAVGHAQAAALDFADSPLDCRSPPTAVPKLDHLARRAAQIKRTVLRPNGTILPNTVRNRDLM